MGKIVVTEFISLDGVIEDPGGSEQYEHGGWTFEFSRGEEGDAFKLKEVADAEAMLLGRTTYEGFAEAWPQREGEFAEKFNKMPKYVYSSTIGEPGWTNTTVLSGDLREAVARVKAAHDGEITVQGSGQLVQALLEQDLVDELHLMVFPVILGRGKRLFSAAGAKKLQRLTDCKTVGDGVTVLVYERQR